MPHPGAIDAMIRWLVLTVVGVGLMILLPRDTFGAEPLLPARGLAGVTPAFALGLTIVVVAVLLYAVHLVQLHGPWVHDRAARWLLVVAMASLVTAAAATFWGTETSMLGSGVLAVIAQVPLAVRIDRLRLRDAHEAARQEESRR